MHSFTDNHGRKWNVKITFPLLCDIRDQLGIDLGDARNFPELTMNPIDLVNVLFVLCSKQARKKKISDRQFGEALHGDCIEDAYKALSGAYLDFCPSRQRKVLRKLMAASEEAEILGVKEVEQRINQIMGSLKDASSAPPSVESNRTNSACVN